MYRETKGENQDFILVCSNKTKQSKKNTARRCCREGVSVPGATPTPPSSSARWVLRAPAIIRELWSQIAPSGSTARPARAASWVRRPAGRGSLPLRAWAGRGEPRRRSWERRAPPRAGLRPLARRAGRWGRALRPARRPRPPGPRGPRARRPRRRPDATSVGPEPALLAGKPRYFSAQCLQNIRFLRKRLVYKKKHLDLPKTTKTSKYLQCRNTEAISPTT